MFKLYRALKEKGVLSLTKRNSHFIMHYNDRRLYPIVDNKLKTKELALEHGIAVPELYGKIATPHEMEDLSSIVGNHLDFVIKPAAGSGGDGIMVITDKVRDYFRTAGGKLLREYDIEFHLSNILNGVYSLGGHSDVAMVEQRVLVEKVFDSISSSGVPDIRVICLLGYPVMAMVRLPTNISGGKANLHQGAIGAGVDIATGTTLHGVWQNEVIEFHPDTLNEIAGLVVPHWQQVLEIAARCYELTGLGYLGVDIVLDKQYGPLMLELNARPGLNIQIANETGLLTRLEMVENNSKKTSLNYLDRIKFSQDNFSQRV